MSTTLPLPEKILRNSTRSPSAAVLKMSFGNGYVQAVPDGINYIKDSWDITWAPLNQAEKDTVIAALEFAGAHGIFSWTPNYESVVKYFRIKDPAKLYSLQAKSNSQFIISTSLEQVFDPGV